MDKLTGIKIKYNDGTYSDQIPVGALAVNIGWDSTHTLMDVIGTVDIANDGSLQDQIIKRNNYIRFHADYSDPQTVTTNNPTGRRVASGQGAVAMGQASISSGYAAFTGGSFGSVSSQNKKYSSEATGAGSIAWNGALATATGSLAFGGTLSNDQMQPDNTSPQYGRSVASGTGSIALGGVANKATGTYAFAGGQNSSAEHGLAFVYGDRVKSGKVKQAVFGQNNVVDSGASLVVGVGASSSNRANAFTTGKDTDGNYITIGSTKITDTVPTSTLTGNVYLANAYGYGADGATFSKFITKSNLTNGSATSATVVYTVPFLTYNDIGGSSSTTLTSDLASRWLKYVVTNYGAEIGTRPVIGQLQTTSNFIATITGSGSSFNTTSDYPTRSSFIATDGSAYTHRFYTFGGSTFVFNDLIGSYGGTITGDLYLGNVSAKNGSNDYSKLLRILDICGEENVSRVVYTVPYTGSTTIGGTATFTDANNYQLWLKWVASNFGSQISGFQPVVAMYSTSSRMALIGYCYSWTDLVSGLPRDSTFLLIPYSPSRLYMFGTSNGTFFFKKSQDWANV